MKKIEEKLHDYQKKIANIAVATSDSVKVEEPVATSDSAEVEAPVATNDSAEVKESAVTSDSAEVEDSTVTSDTAGVEDSAVTSDSAGVEEDPDQPTDAEIEDQVGEVEHELQGNPGYVGKFQALQNRLDAVKNQLDALSTKGVDSGTLQAYYDRVNALSVQINEGIAKVSQVQSKIQEKIKTDDRIQEKAPVAEVPVMKPWNIKFNKKLDAKTLSNLNIIVLDQNQNLVETTYTYSEETKTITVTPLQQYKVGETYTLFIGKEIAGSDGTSLKNAIKMNFSTK